MVWSWKLPDFLVEEKETKEAVDIDTNLFQYGKVAIQGEDLAEDLPCRTTVHIALPQITATVI